MKRFYKVVECEAVEGGYQISLDSRPVRTPMKSLLIVPERALADAVVQEWRDQGEEIEPVSMPLTGLLNVAIDYVEPRRSEVVADLASYAESELLCYRADEQEELCSLQDERWQPLLDWADDTLSIGLSITHGVLPISQPAGVKKTVGAIVERMAPLALTGLLKLVPALGSIVLGLAMFHGRISAEAAYDLSVLEDVWQEGQWGPDSEAIERRSKVKADVVNAERLLRLGRALESVCDESWRDSVT